MCGEQHVAHGHSAGEELALPHGALPGEVAVFLRRQRRHRLLGDGVAKRDRDANGPLREGALRRGVLQGEPQLGRLGVAPPQLNEAQAARSSLGSAATRLMAATKPASYWPMTNSMSAFAVNVSSPDPTRARIRSPKASGAIGGLRPALICPRQVSGPVPSPSCRKLGGALVGAKVEQAAGCP